VTEVVRDGDVGDVRSIERAQEALVADAACRSRQRVREITAEALRELALDVDLAADRRALAALVLEDLVAEAAALRDAERVAHVEEDVVEHGERRGGLLGEIDLDAGARLDALLETALQISDREAGDGDEERRRLMRETERVDDVNVLRDVQA